jgi:basic membrane protein A and related proteins
MARANLGYQEVNAMKKLYILLATFLVGAMLLPACGAPTSDCASNEVFCVGLVTEIGKITDKSFNQSAWEALQQAESELGARIEYIETMGADEYAKNISTFGDKGYDVIVTVGSALGEATAAAAAAHPEIHFIGVDQFQTETVNGVAGLNFPEDNAGFLVGALAALMTKNNKIGAVCATDGAPSIWRFGEGFRAGAAYADQFRGTTTEVIVIYHSDDDMAFIDPEWGQVTARSIMDQGADAIFGCGGTTGSGAVIAAAEAGAYAIGVDTDQYFTLLDAAPRMLTSAMKLISPAVFELIKLSKEGSFPSGNHFGDAGYAPYHDLENEIPDAVNAMMEQIKTGLLDGSIKTNVSFANRPD